MATRPTANDLSRDYQVALPALEALRREAEFALHEAIDHEKLKIHGFESRVKELESIERKASSKQIENPLDQINDIVGVRVICLFRNDLEIVDSVLKNTFSVQSIDDKITESTETFGYMSSHYICTMRDEYNGPRYAQVKDKKFEVQVRTLGMHAWAAISHYLSYKSDWDIPDHLKKSLNALSGLFYITDNEFQTAYEARQLSLTDTIKRVDKSLDEPINLDSMTAYLEKRFPDRPGYDSSSVSSIVSQLHQAGYEKIAEVERDVVRASKVFPNYEQDNPPQNTKGRKFNAIGVVRASLRISSDKFYQASGTTGKEYLKYRKLLE